MKTFHVNNEGYYGEFGGAYVPEILHRCVEETAKELSRSHRKRIVQTRV